MAQEVSTLSAFRIGKLTERVAVLERALIDMKAQMLHYGDKGSHWYYEDTHRDHYRTLAENELIREGLVRPKNVREMER